MVVAAFSAVEATVVEVGVAVAGVEVEVAVQTALMDREMAAPRSKPENSTRYVFFDICSSQFAENNYISQ